MKSFSNNDRFADLGNQINQLAANARRRSLVIRRPDGVCFDQDGKRLINFGSNDYLGLVSDPPASAIDDRLATFGNGAGNSAGSGASSLVSGWTETHQNLADELSHLEESESAVVFPSGFAACSGTVATLARQGDLILSDQLNHASLIDGCRLSRAKCIVYPHRDCDTVASILNDHRSSYSRCWIVTDGVFSMDGSVAPLPQLVEIASAHDAELIVDEAHATGILGEHGCGLCEEFGVKQEVAVRIGTLSKAIGVQGGFVAAPRIIVDYLVNRCRSLIYSTSLSPLVASHGIANLKSLQSQPQRRDRVKRLARQIRTAFEIQTDHSIEASIPIIPIVLGSDQAALDAAKMLFDHGYYVPAIRPPTVPDGTARLRISVSASHTDEMIDGLIEAVKLSTSNVQ